MDSFSIDAGRCFGDLTIPSKLNQRTVAAETAIQKWLKAGTSWDCKIAAGVGGFTLDRLEQTAEKF